MCKENEHTHIIGEIISGDETRLVNLDSLKRHAYTQRELYDVCNTNKISRISGGTLDISFPFETYTLQQYFNTTEKTDLYRFFYCPLCGAPINWREMAKISASNL